MQHLTSKRSLICPRYLLRHSLRLSLTHTRACALLRSQVQGLLDAAALLNIDTRDSGWPWADLLIPLQARDAGFVWLAGVDSRCIGGFIPPWPLASSHRPLNPWRFTNALLIPNSLISFLPCPALSRPAPPLSSEQHREAALVRQPPAAAVVHRQIPGRDLEVHMGLVPASDDPDSVLHDGLAV